MKGISETRLQWLNSDVKLYALLLAYVTMVML